MRGAVAVRVLGVGPGGVLWGGGGQVELGLRALGTEGRLAFTRAELGVGLWVDGAS